MDRLNAYQALIESKRHTSQKYGIPMSWIPDKAFDYQTYASEYVINKGRCAAFLDTGMGKTLVELTTAVNYSRRYNQRVLIITPLAVAFQFLEQAEKFGIDDIEYSRDGKFTKNIVICNYERLHYFNADDFVAVVLDESSILKNFDGAIRQQITSFLKRVKYRFLFTATPSPNDFIELGTSSEALGYLGHTDMLTKFFTNKENTVDPTKIGAEWMLKEHAKTAFFEWVSSWSLSARKPSDLGAFDDSRHILPPLIERDNEVTNTSPLSIGGQMQLFAQVAKSKSEVIAEQRATIAPRCERAYDLAKDKTSVYWVNFNSEGDYLQQTDKDAVQISGGMKLEEKEEILLSFSRGEIKRLITKPKITAFGLNWQHCAHTVFFPTFSYEQYYQAIRRFYRFGQKNEVIVDRVYSDGQKRVMDAIIAKTQKANELFTQLNRNINRDFEVKKTEFSKEIKLPSFIKK